MAWVPDLLAFCQQNESPIDFIATHLYGVKQGFLDEKGNAQLVLDPDPNAIVGSLPKLVDAIRQSKTPSLPLFITEWSASYSPRDAVHDSYISAVWRGCLTGHSLISSKKTARCPVPSMVDSVCSTHRDYQSLHFLLIDFSTN
jgi:hypothetical protein